jgi:hypothetical protein
VEADDDGDEKASTEIGKDRLSTVASASSSISFFFAATMFVLNAIYLK